MDTSEDMLKRVRERITNTLSSRRYICKNAGRPKRRKIEGEIICEELIPEVEELITKEYNPESCPPEPVCKNMCLRG